MKILQVVQFFSPVHGGSAEVPYRLSKELAKRGHEVTIYTSDYKLSQEYKNSIPKVKICHFRSWSNLAEFIITPSMIKRVKKDIKHFDVIHMHNYRTFQNIVVYYYASRCKTPYVLQAHGSVLAFFQKQGLKRIFDLFFGYRILKDASKVVAYHQLEAIQYQNMGVKKDKIEIVTSGVDLLKIENMPGRGEFKKNYSIKNNEKIILFIGRIHKIKGVDLLVEAFADLTKKLNNVRLVIIGPDDGDLSTINNLIKSLRLESKILIPGFVSTTDKIAAYIDADVYVLPSRYDTFPTTVLEACSFSTPVITTNLTGIRDLVNNNVGYAVSFDKTQLSDALFKILTDEELRYYFGERGKRLVREKYSWETIAEQLEKIYNNIK